MEFVKCFTRARLPNCLREVVKNGYFTVRLTVSVDPALPPPYGQLF